MKPKAESQVPLTFDKIKKVEIKTIDGRKNYVRSEKHKTNKYSTYHFYKPICNLI